MSILFESFSYREKVTNHGVFFDRWHGGSFPEFNTFERLIFLNQFLNSLLLHDKIIIRLDALEEMIDLIGINETIILLEREELLILDYWFTPWFMITQNTQLMFMNMQQQRPHDNILYRLKSKLSYSNYLFIKQTLYDKIQSDEMYAYWDQLARDEMYTYFSNDLIKTELKLKSEDAILLNEEESYHYMRFFLLERSISWSRELETHDIMLEEQAKFWLLLKNRVEINKISIESINRLLTAKGIFNLGLLYFNGVITINDILKVRDSTSGIKFRGWMEAHEYQIIELEQKLLERMPSDNKINQLIKWAFATVLDLKIPGAGTAFSFLDTIVGTNKEWTPSIFFDKTLVNTLGNNKLNKFFLHNRY